MAGFLMGMDYIANDSSSFDVAVRKQQDKLYVRAYAAGGIVANTPMVVAFAGSGFAATVFAASTMGWVGVPEDGTALASGCVGWVQIRGNVEDVQCPAQSITGSIGHGVYWAGATGLGASSSAYAGLSGQVAMLTGDATGYSASTTANMFLLGAWAEERY